MKTEIQNKLIKFIDNNDIVFLIQTTYDPIDDMTQLYYYHVMFHTANDGFDIVGPLNVRPVCDYEVVT